jgi:outer membrane biosynthesis protein TonB
MKAGYTISALAHALLLAWGLWSFSPPPLKAPQVDPIVVEVIMETDVTQITAGSKTAKQTPAPTPVVDKVGEVKEQPKEPTLKVAKEEVVTTTAPPPAPPQPDPVPEAKPESKPVPDQKPAEAKPAEPPPPAAVAEPAPDLVAEELRRQEKQKEEQKRLEEQKKREEQKRREAQKKREEEARKREEQKQREEAKNDLTRIEMALNNKRAPSRQEVNGTIVNPNPSLGTTTGRATQLSQNELARLQALLRAQLRECWHPPAGVNEARDLVVTVEFWLNRDGNLSAAPVVKNRSSNPLFPVAADTAVKALRNCQPLRLPAAQYDSWQDLVIDFDPIEMFGG